MVPHEQREDRFVKPCALRGPGLDFFATDKNDSAFRVLVRLQILDCDLSFCSCCLCRRSFLWRSHIIILSFSGRLLGLLAAYRDLTPLC
jgi:hypothetical protein